MKRTVYNYDLKDIAKVGVKSKQKVKGNYSQSGISEENAQYKWSDFLDKDIEDYDTKREYLPEVLTSQLSIYLAYGVLDIIQIFNDLLNSYDIDEQNYEEFIR